MNGNILAKTLCGYFKVSRNSKIYRKNIDIRKQMLSAIIESATCPGCFSVATQENLRIGYTAACGWIKHVDGYRINGTLAAKLRTMNPYCFARYLGRMVDAGISNMGEAESFFESEASAK